MFHRLPQTEVDRQRNGRQQLGFAQGFCRAVQRPGRVYALIVHLHMTLLTRLTGQWPYYLRLSPMPTSSAFRRCRDLAVRRHCSVLVPISIV